MGLVDKIKGLLGQATEKSRPLLKQDTETAEPPPQQTTETAEPPPLQATGAPPALRLNQPSLCRYRPRSERGPSWLCKPPYIILNALQKKLGT